jgi:hypothetical protein
LRAAFNSGKPTHRKKRVCFQNWAVPPGLDWPFPLFPALKRWAKFGRPSGAGSLWLFSSQSNHKVSFVTDSKSAMSGAPSTQPDAQDQVNLQIASYQFRPSPWTLPVSWCKMARMISSLPITAESKSIHHRGDSMNRSTNIRPRRFLALIAMLFGVLLLPAYGQQEVDPTWYNPWAAPNTAVVQSSQPRVAIHRHQRTVRPVSSARVAGKVREKRPTTRSRAS